MKRSLNLILAFLLLSVTSLTPNGYERPKCHTANHNKYTKSDVVVVAHRGASAYGPENSLAAFKQAIKMHADYIELDLRMTKDGHLIAMHDASLKRTTNVEEIYPNRAPWLVRDFNLQEIRQLDAGSWFKRTNKHTSLEEYKQEHVPTFNEVIRFVNHKGNEKVGLYIETKVPQMEKKLVKILRKNGLMNKKNLIIGSLSSTNLRKLNRLAPNVKGVQIYSRKMLIGKNVKQEFKRISRYAAVVGIRKDLVIPKLIEVAHQNGLLVHTWTVNKQDDMALLLSLGVDGEITNKPDQFVHLLHKHHQKQADRGKVKSEL
jgi:alkaline phosphatase D